MSDSGVTERNETRLLLSPPANAEWRPPGNTRNIPVAYTGAVQHTKRETSQALSMEEANTTVP